MSADQVRVCLCGVAMVPTTPGSSVKWCLNCDTVQPHEAGVKTMPRRITPQDRRFHLAWEQLKRVYYRATS